ncbi:hypothetical protein, unlikely [Trypanosoma brucei gambiense DAL972]|uniref:Uncharacterized protein n=1 Tax=Trypanosoma brucei gambiense (strain MHOM/CI/86/DAL972) TaxID=679716 RepID=C9ZQ70_TRYB9|nr:hypothetical protein, unlikely [Trypanosoma brucei gambiense DAL972]CBH11550.1 hypothetical protein, unlikely [Trypanosoma brucei gambiense DAL972]|eukprot:XP_011773835.1 hypothetical protein, unlikely [Trypanosoma brucei gambiense DAL972]
MQSEIMRHHGDRKHMCRISSGCRHLGRCARPQLLFILFFFLYVTSVCTSHGGHAYIYAPKYEETNKCMCLPSNSNTFFFSPSIPTFQLSFPLTVIVQLAAEKSSPS